MSEEKSKLQKITDVEAEAEMRRAIEAILMVAIDPVAPGILAQLFEVPVDEIERICDSMVEQYEEAKLGFLLVRIGGGYRFQSNPEKAQWVERFVLEGQSRRLTAAAMETLSIVAYKQPISRAQISAIRGVDVEGVMRNLQQRGLIDEVSRDVGPGNAVLYGSSEFEQGTQQFERLQKVLARAGIGSRRVCEKLIVDQRVTVNGEIPELGEKVDPETSQIEVDGLKIGVRQDLVYYLVNKPIGIITTSKDPQKRSTVIDLVPTHPRVFPVGRLDADTEGLIFMTNDGDLTHYLTHPSFGIEKEYLVQVEVKPSRNAIRQLRQGVELDDGLTAPAKVSLVDEKLLKIVIHEGRNRQVRRMCESIGHPVIRLVRSRIGPIVDRSLSPGSFRELTNQELRSIRKILSKDFSN